MRLSLAERERRTAADHAQGGSPGWPSERQCVAQGPRELVRSGAPPEVHIKQRES